MTAIRFFTDEDVYAAAVTALRREGIEAVSTPGSIIFASRRHGDTEEHSEFAVNNSGDAIFHERLTEIQHVANVHLRVSVTP